MKTLIVYFSLDGNCALVAEELQKALGADVLRLQTVDEKKREGLAKYLWGGRQVFTHAQPQLKPYEAAVDAYDRIIIGSPVWAGSPVPALHSFLAQTPIRNKKVALFCCHMGPKHILEKMKALLPGNTFLGEIDFVTPAKENRQQIGDRIQEWAKTLD